MSELLPRGVQLLDAPYPLAEAIAQTLTFLSWQDELPREDMPPKRIWLDGKKLERHFKAVKQRRDDEMKTGGNPEEWSGDMVSNDAASMLIAGD